MPFYDRSAKSGKVTAARQNRLDNKQKLTDSSILVGVVESTTDFTKSGSFRVSLFSSSKQTDRTQAIGQASVRMLFPFYSLKDYRNSGDDPQRFGDSQQAYGMVFPAPQIGTKGIVLLVDGNTSSGYWCGYLHEDGMNHAIPDYANSTSITADNQTYNSYSSPTGLPAGEYLKKQAIGQVANGDERRPIHPFANILKAQGLLVDTVRGTTTSSFSRDTSSRIFGINTPGSLSNDPFDKKMVGASKSPFKVTPLGGHSFTMDDGDEQGLNNLVRLRSRSGHQILLHDTDDLIYIGNAKGTAWVELTADGKIDIFASDSVSVHSKADFNFVADRDINFEAKRNINYKAANRFYMEGSNLRLLARNDATIEVRGPIDIRATDTQVDINHLHVNTLNTDWVNRKKLRVKTANFDLSAVNTARVTASENIDLSANTPQSFASDHVVGRVYHPGFQVIADGYDGFHIYQCTDRNIKYPERKIINPGDDGAADFWEVVPWEESFTTEVEGLPRYDIRLDSSGAIPGQIHMLTNGQIYVSTDDNINVKTPATVFIDGTAAVHLNLPGAIPASTALESSQALATPGKPTQDLPVWSNPDTNPTAQWDEFNWYKVPETFDIVKRKPVHEPWVNHENASKTRSSTSSTDRDSGN
jgi:hypothetical protein